MKYHKKLTNYNTSSLTSIFLILSFLFFFVRLCIDPSLMLLQDFLHSFPRRERYCTLFSLSRSLSVIPSSYPSARRAPARSQLLLATTTFSSLPPKGIRSWSSVLLRFSVLGFLPTLTQFSSLMHDTLSMLMLVSTRDIPVQLRRWEWKIWMRKWRTSE